MSREDKTREAISRTAKNMRDHAASKGVQMTQTQAREQVAKARARGDRERENGNR